MFWDKWIPKKYLVRSEICSVEVVFSETGHTFFYTHLKNKNNKLEVIYTVSSERLEFSKSIEKNKVPIVVIVNGRGIILKKIVGSETSELTYDEIIRSHLPAFNTADFFIQIFKTENNYAFITLCRKEQINPILESLKDKKSEIVNVFIGAAAIEGLKPLWTGFDSLPTTLHTIELSNNIIDTIVINPLNDTTCVKIEDITIDSQHTLGFAAGLSYLLQNRIAETDSPEILEIEQKHIEKNKLRLLMVCCISIAFIMAIINGVFYAAYFAENKQLDTELSIYQGKYKQINQLLNDYQEKKGLIENAGILNKNKLSEYADRIGATIPDDVILSELYFNPKNENEESEDSLVTFYNKQLILRGKCNKSIIVNEWLNVLKMQQFVKGISLEKFSYNNEGMLPNFEIKILTE